MKAFNIHNFSQQTAPTSLQTKFGGQPDWLDTPQWPVSLAWDNRPMKFIGQIRLDHIYDDIENTRMAYLFITQPDDEEDDFFDPDIIDPEGGEQAVILQPEGTVPSCIKTIAYNTGPTVDHNHVWIPQMCTIEEDLNAKFETTDIDKMGGIPAFYQGSEGNTDDRLLLQLHTNWLPFYIRAGGAPTLFVMLNDHLQEGYMIIEDM